MTPKEALDISRKVAENVKKRIKDIVGSPESNITVGMGKDGTPTKKIDSLAEQAALEILGEEDVVVVSEEAGIVGEGDIFVALDPIDGTFNATSGIPFFSVALCFSKSPKLEGTFFGYVKNLATDDEYYAINKAYKNDERIRVGDKDDVKQCNAILYYPIKRYPFKRLRIFGSASLEICLVAEGSFDCFIDLRKKNGKGFLRVYDVAASIFIAEKADATISDLDEGDVKRKNISMEERFRLLISNEKLHERIKRVL